jgi:hypothetical protein
MGMMWRWEMYGRARCLDIHLPSCDFLVVLAEE